MGLNILLYMPYYTIQGLFLNSRSRNISERVMKISKNDICRTIYYTIFQELHIHYCFIKNLILPEKRLFSIVIRHNFFHEIDNKTNNLYNLKGNIVCTFFKTMTY